MMNYSYQIHDKNYTIESITFNELKNIQLLITLNDNKQLFSFFDSKIKDSSKINIIDKMILILFNYLINIDNTISFNFKEEDDQIDNNKKIFNAMNGNNGVTFYISDIIENLKSIQISDEKIMLSDNSYIVIGLPYTFFDYNQETLNTDLTNYEFYQFIHEINIDGENVEITNDIIDALPGNIISKVSEYINIWCYKMKHTPLLSEKYSQLDCHPVTLFEYIKKIFTYDMKTLVNIEYNLFKYIRVSNYYDLTKFEVMMLIEEWKEDLQHQEKEAEKEDNSLPTPPNLQS